MSTAAAPTAETPAGDPPSPAPTPPAPPTPPPPSPTQPGSGAEARIRELNDAKKAADERAAAAEAKVQELEQASMSEKERAEAQAKTEKERADAAEAKIVQLERSGWARDAAVANHFIDPVDAVARLDLNALDTETKVQNAVKKLAEDSKHLVNANPQPGFGNLGGTGQPGGAPPAEVPVGPDGKPDTRLGLGQDLLRRLQGR